MSALRLESLGRHSLSLMHDLNNLMTCLGAYIEMAKADPNRLDLAASVSRRASALCQGMTMYVRTAGSPMDILDLSWFLREYAAAERRDLKATQVVVYFDHPREPAMVAFNPFTLRQVLENIVTNAGAAGSETVTIRLKRLADGRSVVEVEDYGPGLPATVLAKLGEPLNCSRPGGTGLGIFLASEIMRDHGGSLTARNKELQDGPGAVFELTFPAAPLGTSGDESKDQAGI